MTSWIWVNIGSGNGLLPAGMKPLTEPILTYYKWDSVVFSWDQFHKCLKYQSLKYLWKFYSQNYATSPRDQWVNSLALERSERDSKNVIFNLVLLIDIFRSSHDIALEWMPQDLTDDKSTLVQVMAWCRQATSHYLNQCWLCSFSPYGVARPQWVNR